MDSEQPRQGSDSTYRSIHGGTAAPPSRSIGDRSLLCSDRRTQTQSLRSGPVRSRACSEFDEDRINASVTDEPMACHRAGEVHQQRSPTV
jgi:hypothetical protein